MRGFFFPFYLFMLCIRVFYLHVCLYITCVPGACGGLRRASNVLELKLDSCGLYHVGVGSPESSARIVSVLNYKATSPDPEEIEIIVVVIIIIRGLGRWFGG